MKNIEAFNKFGFFKIKIKAIYLGQHFGIYEESFFINTHHYKRYH